ncbi:MAG: replicative DNA helicase [Actinomycetia bacterium]|nr:replicative DNA helicase [Actinomycetes bacterium]
MAELHTKDRLPSIQIGATSSSGGRIPPHDLDAERALLGSMLLSSEIQNEALTLLGSQDFFRTAHQVIFDAMTRLASRNENFDVLSLADQLTSMAKLEAVGGRDYLADLSTSVPTTAFWERYANIVLRLSTYRRLISAGTRIVALGYETPEDETTTISDAEDTLFKVTQERLTNDFTALAEELPRTFRHFEDLQSRGGKTAGVPTGFDRLDLLTTGLRGGDLIILGARPSVGKTALALNIAVESARQGTAVSFFSLEMGIADLTARVVSSEALVNSWNLRSGKIRDEDWAAITQAMSRLSALNLAIDDSPSLNIMELRAKAKRRLHDATGNKLIVIDYLQLMQPSRRNTESRQVEISEISRGLKVLAKDLDVPIIALSQLSRGIEMRDDKRPMLSDLRESGSLEQDADIVLFLDRNTKPPADGEELGENQEANLYLAKHRNGPTGTIKLSYINRYTKFVSMASSSLAQD